MPFVSWIYISCIEEIHFLQIVGLNIFHYCKLKMDSFPIVSLDEVQDSTKHFLLEIVSFR